MVCVALFLRDQTPGVVFGAGAVEGDGGWGDDAVFGGVVVDAVEGFGVGEEGAVVGDAELGD